ncbi:fructose-1,6-bisphosphatase [Pelagophyceae sp. CCMP2097]|nr:fructose-1,6-bisphosphatase [Pelagophyceae sp. CCMP2097]|mmetsp:Transcript_16084/g.56214  ORF Transcript_16084/g.56214 Transcript_16084/m.56214 type:complete len:389 (-) Transcript_16084:39-1205(-)
MPRCVGRWWLAWLLGRVGVAFVLRAPASAPSARNAGEAQDLSKRMTLTKFMIAQTAKKPELEDLESLMASIQMACKTISALVQHAAVDGMTGLDGAVNVQGEDQKKLDVISNDVLKAALSYTGKLGIVASEEESFPVIVEEAYDSRYVAVFDPLDGSSNIDASIATGTIFGIFEQTEECLVNDVAGGGELDAAAQRCLLNTLQPGKSLVAAGYCMYSSSTIMVITVGDGVQGFTLDPRVGDFVLSHPDMRIPNRGSIYSVNEANSLGWDQELNDYILQCKQNGYSSRYIGSMVGDVHRTILYGGLYAYPADKKHKLGKIRLLYEAAPISFIVEQAGGKCSTGRAPIIGIVPTSVHQRTPVFLGSTDDIDDLEAHYERADARRRADEAA